MEKFVIFGNPVAHSKSPQMQNAGFENLNYNGNYEKHHLEDGRTIKQTFLENSYEGANITVPHKEHAYANADEVRGLAQKIHAVNTYINENGKVMVAGSLGSLRLEGCYWVSNENATSLDKLILKKKHDPENGLYAFDAPAFVEEKSCSNGFPNSHWSSTKVVSNGNGKGAARLQGWANFNYVVTPGSGPDMFDALLTFRLRGVSYRKGRRRWKKERTNHTFNWDFRVDRLGLNLETGVWVSIDPRDFSGTDTHNNNQEAIRTVQVGNFPMNGNAVILTRMVLETVRTGTLNGGTSQTTNQLSPSFVSYGCQ